MQVGGATARVEAAVQVSASSCRSAPTALGPAAGTTMLTWPPLLPATQQCALLNSGRPQGQVMGVAVGLQVWEAAVAHPCLPSGYPILESASRSLFHA